MAVDPGLATVIVATIAAMGAFANTAIAVKQGRKVDETHKQVTVNHHSSKVPTVLDRIDDVDKRVHDVFKLVIELGTDFNAHVAHSNQMDQRLLEVESEVNNSSQ